MLAQLLSFATPGAPLPPLFLKLLDQLMTDEMWANRGLIPATVQLLQIYFRVAPAHLVSGQYVQHFRSYVLVSSPQTHEALTRLAMGPCDTGITCKF